MLVLVVRSGWGAMDRSSRLHPARHAKEGKKVETPLASMPRNLCAACVEADSVGCRDGLRHRHRTRPACVEGEGPGGTTAARGSCIAMVCDAAAARTGRFLGWACARGSRFTVWFGAGFEPATLGVQPMLYPTELSSGRRAGFEPATCSLRCRSTIEPTSLRGTPSPDPRHAPRQCRAHRTGMQARTAVERSSMFRIGP